MRDWKCITVDVSHLLNALDFLQNSPKFFNFFEIRQVSSTFIKFLQIPSNVFQISSKFIHFSLHIRVYVISHFLNMSSGTNNALHIARQCMRRTKITKLHSCHHIQASQRGHNAVNTARSIEITNKYLQCVKQWGLASLR